jgi:hypothetical protein
MSWEPLLWAIGYGWLLGCTLFSLYLFYRYTKLPEVRNSRHRLIILALMPVVVAGLGAMAWAVYLAGGFRDISYVAIAILVAVMALVLSRHGLQLGIARRKSAQ